MGLRIEEAIAKIKACWSDPTMSAVLDVEAAIASLCRDQDLQGHLKSELLRRSGGVELHRDQDHCFVLLAYAEKQGEYRIPHDHGDAWVIYSVISGEVEMGSYFKFGLANGGYRLVLKNQEKLSAGCTRIYFPGEIHDTRCVSNDAVILRLTSSDLKMEERLGRMHRYQPGR